MKNRLSVIFLWLILFSACSVFFPPKGLPQEEKSVEGMIQIERNHLYMIAVGSDHGVARGDKIAVYRSDVKVAEARLISVLPDSSMAEMLLFFNVTDVFESDSVRYISRLDSISPIKPTLTSDGTSDDEEEPTDDSWAGTRDVEKRGLLGSDTSIGRQVYLAKEPLHQEIEGLKLGMETLREDFDGRMETVLGTVKGGASRTALREREKLVDTEKKYKKKLTEQREALEAEFAYEKDNLERRIAVLTRQISEASEVDDKRAKQLVRDLKSTERKVNELRASYEKQRKLEEGGWLEKIAELEDKFQGQLRSQQEESKRELIYTSDNYEDQITLLKDQIKELKDNNERKMDELLDQLKDEQYTIKSLTKEKSDIDADNKKKNTQLVKSKKEIIEFKDLLNSEKASYTEKIKAFKLPYEREIRELKDEIASLRKDNAGKMKSIQEESSKNLLAEKEKITTQLSLAEDKYELELTRLKESSKEISNSLQSQLDTGQTLIKELERENARLASDINHKEKNIQQLKFNIETLTGESAELQEKFENEVKLSKSTITEDKSLIKFLNDEMATLTDDIERKDQQIDKLEKALEFLEEEYSKTKTTNRSDVVNLTDKYEREIEELQKSALDGLSTTNANWQAKLKSQKEEYLEKFDAQNIEFKNKVDDLENQISAFKGDSSSTIKDLQGKLKERNSVIKVRDGEVADLNSKVEKGNAVAAKQEDVIAQLNENIKRMKLAHSEEIIDFNKQINAYKGDSSDTINNLQDQLREKAVAVKVKNSEVESLKSELKKKGVNTAQLKETITQLNEKLDQTKLSHSEELVRLDEQMSALSGDSDSALSQIQSQLKERDTFVKTLENQNANLKSDLLKKSKQEAKLDSTITNLNEHIERIKQIHSKEITDLNSQIANFKGDSNTVIRNLQDQLKENVSTIRSRDSEIIGLNSEIEKKNVNTAQLKETITQLNEKLDQTKLSHSEELVRLDEQMSALSGDSDSALSQIQSQLKERDGFVKSLKDKIASLNSDLQKRSASIDKLNNTITQLNDNIESTKLTYSERIADFNNQMSKLRGESSDTIKNLQVLLKEKDSVKGSLENKITQLNSDLRQKSKQETRLEDVIDLLNENIENAKLAHSKEIADFGNQISVLKEDNNNALSQLQKQLQERDRVNKSLENQVTALNSNLDKKNNNIGQLEGTITQLNENIKKIKQVHSGEITDFKNQLSLFKGDSNDAIKSLQEQLKEKATTVGSKNGQIAGLNSELEKKNKIVAKLQDSIALMNESFENSKRAHMQEIANFKNQMSSSKSDSRNTVKKLQNKIEEKNSSIKSLEEINSDLTSDLSERSKQISELEGEIALMNENVNQVKLDHAEEVAQLDEKIKILNGNSSNAIKELQGQLEEKNSLIKLTEVKNDGLTSDLKQKTRHASRLEDTITQMGENIEKIKQSHSEEISDFKNQISSFKSDSDDMLKNLQEQLEKKDFDNRSLEDKIARLNSDLDKKKESTKRFEEQIVQLNGKIGQIKLAHSDEMTQLVNQIDALRGDKDSAISGLQDLLKERNSFVKSLERQNADLNTNLQNKSKQEAKLEETIVRLNEDISQVKLSHSEEIESFKNQISATRADSVIAIKDLQDRLQTNRSTNQSLENQITKLHIDLQKKSEVASQFEETITQLNEKINQTILSHSKEIAGYKNQMSTVKGDSNATIKNLQDELEEQFSIVKRKSSEIAGLNSELEKERKGATKLEETIAQLNEKIDQTKLSHSEEIVDFKNQISALNNSSDSAIKDLQNQLKKKSSAVKAKNGEIAELNTELQKKNTIAVKLEEKIVQLNENIDETKTSHDEEINTFKNQMAALKSDNDITIKSLQEQLKENVSTVRTKNDEITDLNAVLEKERKVSSKYKGTIAQLNGEIDLTKKTHSEEIAQLDEQINALAGDSNKAIAKLRNQLQEKGDVNRSLEERISKLNSDLLKGNELAGELKDTIAQLNERIDQTKSSHTEEINTFKNQMAALKSDNDITIKSLQEQLKENVSTVRTKNDEITDLNAVLEKERKVSSKHKGTIAQLNESISQTKLLHSEEIAEFDQVINTLEGESDNAIKDLRNQLKKKDATAKEKDGVITGLNSELEKERKQVTKLEEQIVQLNGTIEQIKLAHLEEIGNFKNRINVVNSDHDGAIKSLQEQLKENLLTVRARDSEITGLNSELQKERKVSTKLEGTIVQLKEEIDLTRLSHAKELAQLDQEIDTLESDSSTAIKDLNAQLKKKELALKEKDGAIAGLNSELRNRNATATNLEETIAQMNEDSANRQVTHAQEIAHFKDQIIAIKGESGSAITKYQDQLGERDSLVKSLKDQITGLNSDLQKKGNRVSRLEATIAQLDEEIDQTKLSHSEEVAELQSSHSQDLADYKNQISALNDSSNSAVKDLQNQLKKKSSAVKAKDGEIVELNTELQKKNAIAVKLEEKIVQFNENTEQLKLAHSEEINTFKNQMAALNNDNDITIKSLQEQLKENVSTVRVKNNEITDLNAVLEKERKSLTKLKETVTQLNERIDQTKLSHSEEVAELQSSHSQDLADYKNQISALNDSSNSAVKDLQNQLKKKDAAAKEKDEAVAGLNSELAKERKQVTKLEEQIVQFNENTEQLKLAHSEEITVFKDQMSTSEKDNDTTIKSLQAQLKENSSTIRARDGEVAGLNIEIEKKNKTMAKLEDAIVQLNENTDQIKLAHSDEITKLENQINILKDDSELMASNYQNQLEEKVKLIQSQEDQNEDLNSTLEKRNLQLAKYEDEVVELKGSLEDIKVYHAEKIKHLMRPLGIKYEQAKKDLQSTKKSYEDQLSKFKMDAQNDLKSSEEQWNAKLALQESDYQKKLDVQKVEYEGLMQKLGTQISKLREDSDTVIQNLKKRLEKNASVIKTKDSEIAGLISKLEGKSAISYKLEDTIAQLNEDIDSTKSAHYKQITHLKDQIRTLKGNSDNVVGQLQDQLEEKERKVKSLQAKNERLYSNIDSKKMELAKSEDKNTLLKIELEETKFSHVEKVKNLKRPLENKYKKAVSELELIKKLHKNQIEKLKNNAQYDIGIADDQWKTKLAIVEERHEKEINTRKEDYEGKIEKLVAEVSEIRLDSKDSIKALQDELDETKSLVKSLENKSIALNSEIQSKDNRLGKYKEKLTELQSQNNVQRDDFNSEIIRLKDELQEKEFVISSLEDSNKSLNSEFKEKDVQLKEFSENIFELNESLTKTKLSSAEKINFEKMTLGEKIKELNNELDLVKKNHEKELADLHERKLLEETVAHDKRVELAKESMAAEVKMLKSELAFARENHDEKVTFLQERLTNDLRIAQDRHEAQMNANDARWRVKLATLQEEHRQQLASGTNTLKQKLNSNRNELRETIETMEERLALLKNSSDNQIKELEAELATKQHQLDLRESDYKRLYSDTEERWAAKLSVQQKQHRDQMAELKKTISEEFLLEKKELRSTVVDLTQQIRDMRDMSSQRIKELESDLEKKEYQLSLVESTSSKGTFDNDEKWRMKLIAAEEKYQRDLINQKREIEKQAWAQHEKEQGKVGDLSSQLNTLRQQQQLDLAFKDEEMAAKLAMITGRHEQEINKLNKEIEGLMSKANQQDDELSKLKVQNSDLKFNLENKERSLSHMETRTGNLKKEMRMSELSLSEKYKLSQESFQAKIDDLTAKLTISRDKAMQERIELEDKWREKLRQSEADYYEKFKKQNQSLENEVNSIQEQLNLVRLDKDRAISEIRDELEDSQTSIQLLSREKYDLSRSLEKKDNEIIGLNEEIIRLKDSVENLKDLSSVSPEIDSGDQATKLENIDQSLVSKSGPWYTQSDSSSEYYSVVRKAILSKFKEFDFSKYSGKAGIVQIDFELLPDGTAKSGPKFVGTQDEGLKDLLMQCFEDAAPFPPFPKDLKKESQRFALSVSFKK